MADARAGPDPRVCAAVFRRGGRRPETAAARSRMVGGRNGWTRCREDPLVLRRRRVMMEPGEPAHAGKTEIRQYVTRMLQTPGFSIRWVSENPVFSPSGDLAYMRGAHEMTLPGPTGAIT